MERRFDMSDFEQSLKDYADQFKIMPSKRVWNGIYNHLHPGSKWPSITVAIVFIITLVSIGNLNNSSNRLKKTPAISSNTATLPAANDNPKGKNGVLSEKNNAPITLTEKSEAVQNSQNSTPNLKQQRKTPTGNNTTVSNTEAKKDRNEIKKTKTNSLSLNNISSYNDFKIEKTLGKKNSTVNQQITGFLNFAEPDGFVLSPFETAFLQNEQRSKTDIQIAGGTNLFYIPARESLSIDVISQDAKITTEDNSGLKKDGKSIIAKKVHRKKKNNVEWLYYIEPTISYVSLHSKDVASSSLLNPASLVVLTNQSPFQLIRNPRPGFEAGIQAGFHISKKLQFISGLNLSYSAYSNVSNLVHPTFASLILYDNSRNLYAKNFITHYGNGESQSNFPLVNYRFETGIPVGLQYNIWKNDKLAIDVTSVVEPKFLLKSNAYIISSDSRYYVTDPGLIRTVNLEGKFGSYLSFYAKKIKWHIGPDIHYQLFSSYNDIYPTQEHFFDYGIRIGISK